MISILAFLSLIRMPLGVVFCILDFACQSERKWNVCDHYWLDYCYRRRGLKNSWLLTVERVFVAWSTVDYTLHYDGFLIVLSGRGSCVGLLVLGDGDTVVDEMAGRCFVDDHTLDSKPIWSSWPVDKPQLGRIQAVAPRAYLSLMVEVGDSTPTMSHHWARSTLHSADHCRVKCCYICRYYKYIVLQVRTVASDQLTETKWKFYSLVVTFWLKR